MTRYLFIFFAYLIGLIFGGLWIVQRAIFGNEFPDLAWWQWVLAPLGIGTFVLISHVIFESIQEKTGIGAEGNNESKRARDFVILFIFLAVVIIGPAIYRISNS